VNRSRAFDEPLINCPITGRQTKTRKTKNLKIQRLPSFILATALVAGAPLLHAGQTFMVSCCHNPLLAQKTSDAIAVAMASFFARGGCQLRRSAYVNSKTAMIQHLDDSSGQSVATAAAQDTERDAGRSIFEGLTRRNQSGLAALSDKHGRIVFFVASKILPNPRESEAVTQGVFLSLWRSPASDEPGNNIIPFSPPRSWIPWAIAASFAVFAGVLMFQNLGLRTRATAVAEEATWSRVQLSVLQPTPEAPGATARIAWNPIAEQGRLWTSNLPQFPADKSYQLWVFKSGNPQPISAGIFDPGLSNEIPFRSTQPKGSPTKFAVTIEQRGGVPIPAGPVVLVGEIES